jgi:hypothetical protein
MKRSDIHKATIPWVIAMTIPFLFLAFASWEKGEPGFAIMFAVIGIAVLAGWFPSVEQLLDDTEVKIKRRS